jgi:hypothetical protein
MSSEPVVDDFLFPEDQERLFYLIDHEAGPSNLSVTADGMQFQHWLLTYNQANGDVTLTPQTSGTPIILAALAPNAQQVSFCFDQNARPAVCWATDNVGYLYWYDSDLNDFTIDTYNGIVSCMLTLDDKRTSQIENNDIHFWFTRESSPNVYDVYVAVQRERFTNERLMATDVPPFLLKSGMNDGLRIQIELTYKPPV